MRSESSKPYRSISLLVTEWLTFTFALQLLIVTQTKQDFVTDLTSDHKPYRNGTEIEPLLNNWKSKQTKPKRRSAKRKMIDWFYWKWSNWVTTPGICFKIDERPEIEQRAWHKSIRIRIATKIHWDSAQIRRRETTWFRRHNVRTRFCLAAPISIHRLQ